MTGWARGIGQSQAIALAEAGADVVLIEASAHPSIPLIPTIRVLVFP
jgi:NAD(P)-dependent dehydrogenase (short-subunit alcohol dehydrogenase family)